MKHTCYMSVENDCNIRLTCMLPCACYCLLDACNMHVTCALFRIGITLGKLIGLLFLFCLPLLSILFLKTKRNDLARPVMGTIFLVVMITTTRKVN